MTCRQLTFLPCMAMTRRSWLLTVAPPPPRRWLARSPAVALGTVSSNLPAAIEEMQAGQASFKVDAVRGWLLLRFIGPDRRALDAVLAGSSRLS